MTKTRCSFVSDPADPRISPALVAYHDCRWCKPEHSDQELFTMLVLETMQAGISWSIVLQKESSLRQAFDGFDPALVAAYGEEKVQALMQDPHIIRNQRKIRSAITNANAFLQVQREFGSFDTYIWSFTNGAVIDHRLAPGSPLPAQDELSAQVSRDLKKRGFQFVGPVIVYSYLQAVGIINDHWVCCEFR